MVLANVPETLREIKTAFRETFADPPGLEGPRSIFLIGSTAGDESGKTGWYQDVDVHLLFDRALIDREQLELVREGMQAIGARFSERGAHVGWDLRDRHWKLVPRPSAGLNLSLHATLANSFDYQRRIFHNPILGWNMYRTCEVLAGDHPGRILPSVPPAALDHFHGVGGIGWMIENFYRALWLHFTVPDRQDFFPYLAGYCWNVVSSIGLQLYTLLRGGAVTSRRGALRFALDTNHLSMAVRDDLLRIYEARYSSELSGGDLRDVVDGAGRAVRALAEAAAALSRAPDATALDRATELGRFSRSLHEPLRRALGHPVWLRERHHWIRHDDRLYDSFGEQVEALRGRYANPTSLELFESLSWLVEEGLEDVTRLYFWSDLNVRRLIWSHDFDSSRSRGSLVGALWGWEDGCQALLQRLNETFVRRGSSELGDVLARASRAIASERLREAGMAATAAGVGDDLFACASDLASWLSPGLVSR